MARKRRVWIPQAYHHIYARGNNRQNIFHNEADMRQVFRLLSMVHSDFKISISAYCIMTNHYHFLLKSEEVSISKVMGIFNKRYTDYYNRRYEHVGHVFQQRFNSSPILIPQNLLNVSRYIHRNPINTKIPMVSKMEDYPYSSYQFYKRNTPPPYPFVNLTDLPANFYLPTEKTNSHYCHFVEREEDES
ncbi:REP element-mobilizing transposase RayT [Oikeobacillus pervagus]|uniref:REP element-mobilizing transposase RayT n=1 Tax=Oikeobacillus pervagus TaxID=1325931 RepID=A0AAJ1SYR0_9BACI|nr:REP element-mobilizing transposase RayT [Oikeobacillus pervagus]